MAKKTIVIMVVGLLICMMELTVAASNSDATDVKWVTVDGVEGGMLEIGTIASGDNMGKCVILSAEDSVTIANIPDEINGKQVVEIWEWAFDFCTDLKQVTIPEGVTEIEDYVFYGCENLTSVTVSSELVRIESTNSFGESPDNLVFYTDEYNVVVDEYVNTENYLRTYIVGDAPDTPYDAMEFGWMDIDGIEGGQVYFIIQTGTDTVLNEDGTTTTTQFNNGGTIILTEETIITADIPDNIGGVPVQTIGDDAFEGNTVLSSVVIPSSVERIGESAFQNCSAIKILEIQEGVEYIHKNAFYGCTSIESITIPSTVTSLGTERFTDWTDASTASCVFDGCLSLESILVAEDNAVFASIDGVLFNKDISVLYYCPKAKFGELIVPDSVEEIADNVLAECYNLTKVVVNEGVTEFPEFGGCESLEVIEIPSSVSADLSGGSLWGLDNLQAINVSEDNEVYCDINGTLYSKDYQILYKNPAFSEETEFVIMEETNTIRTYALEDCRNLISFNVEENNETYMAIDGILFSKDGTILVKYPNGNIASSYEVPEGVTTLGTDLMGAQGFCGCYNLVSIEIPSTIIYRSYYYSRWFNNCISLEQVIFSEGINEINQLVFDNCPAMESIILPSTITTIDTTSFRVFDDDDNDGWGTGDIIEGLTIYMYEDNEYVRTYAIENGITYSILEQSEIIANGDVNGDDTVNVTDIMLMYKAINEMQSLSSEQKQSADINGDDAINVTDVMLMYKHINEVELLF